MLALVVPTTLLSQSPALVAPQEPVVLEDVLKNTPWNVESRGPLLVVGAAKISAKLPLPEPAAQGYNLTSLAAAFGLMPVRIGTVTALSPTRSWQVRKPTLTAEELLHQRGEYLTIKLLESLTPSQWKELTGEKGLGMESLSGTQQALLSGIQEQVSFGNGQGETVLISPQERHHLRLRIGQKVVVHLLPQEPQGPSGPLTDTDSTLARATLNARTFPDLPVTRFELLPTRQKTSELDLSRLTAPCSLLQQETVGALLKRMETKTHLRLMAAPWLAEQSITARGSAAPVGDTLKAICRSLDGTFRRVGEGADTVYVLTQDQEGLATQLARWVELKAKSDALLAIYQEKLQKRPRDLYPIPSKNPYGFTAEQLQRGKERLGIALTELAIEVQSLLKKKAGEQTYEVTENGQDVTKFYRTDRISLATQVEGSLILPDKRELPWPGLTDIAVLFDPQQLITPVVPNLGLWRERVVVLAPHTVDEAKEAVILAQKAHQTAIWLAVPARTELARPLLDAAIAEGKRLKFPVGALMRPLWWPKNELVANAPEDQNLLGETIPELQKRHPEVPSAHSFFFPLRPGETCLVPTISIQKATAQSLIELAKMEGLATLAVHNLAPPYYLHQVMASNITTYKFGYNLHNRLAFLNQTGCDPVDLIGKGFSLPDAPAEFGFQLQIKQRGIQSQWERFLYSTGEDFLKMLHPILKSVAPALPLYLKGMNVMLLWTKPSPSLRSFDSLGLRWMDPFPYQAPNRSNEDFWRIFQTNIIPGAGPTLEYQGYIAYFADISWRDAKAYLQMMEKFSDSKKLP